MARPTAQGISLEKFHGTNRSAKTTKLFHLERFAIYSIVQSMYDQCTNIATRSRGIPHAHAGNIAIARCSEIGSEGFFMQRQIAITLYNMHARVKLTVE